MMRGLCLTLLLVSLAALSDATSDREKLTNMLKKLLSVKQENKAEAKFIFRTDSTPHHIGVILGQDVSICPIASSCTYEVFVAKCDPKADSACQAEKSSAPAHYDQLGTSPSGNPGFVPFSVLGGRYYVWEDVTTANGQKHSGKNFRRIVNVPVGKSEQESAAKFIYRTHPGPHLIGVTLGRDVSKCPTPSSCKVAVFVASCDPQADSTCQAEQETSAVTYDKLGTSPTGTSDYVNFNVLGGTYYVWEVVITSNGQHHSSKQFRKVVNVSVGKAEVEDDAEAKFIFGIDSTPHHIGVILGQDVSKCPNPSSCKYTVFVASCDPRTDSTCQADKSSAPAHFDQLGTSPSGRPGFVHFSVLGGRYYVWEDFTTASGVTHSGKNFRKIVNVPVGKSDLLEQLVKALTS